MGTLSDFFDPYLQQTWGDCQAVVLSEASVTLPYPCEQVKAQLQQALAEHLGAPAQISLKSEILAHKTQAGVQPIGNIKNIIAVASGKGGVGKSTTALNVALALKAHGAKVGLLDADIHGPNQPGMLAHAGEKPQIVDKQFQPIEHFGLATMSIGYLIDAEQPTIWRGPMVSTALSQMLTDTAWPALDYLIVDMPPGTGDVQLTMSQKIPVSGAVIVTTPQNVALQDAQKGLAMFKKVGIPVLGAVENMAYYHCPACGHDDAIFGQGGGERLAEQFSLPLLGRIPLNSAIRQGADEGKPAVLFADTAIQTAYLDTAFQLAVKLSLQARAYADKLLKIKVHHQQE